MSLQVFVFLLAALFIVTGALGVVLSRHPVHAALFLIQTLFGVAVEFLVVEAHFLAAIQVIVYAGAIVILFLFVIMLLGVDSAENMRVEPIIGQRPLAIVTGGALLGLLLGVINSVDSLTGIRSSKGSLDAVDQTGAALPNVNQLAESVFTDHVFAFEVTGLLLTVAVVGAVVMARRIPGALQSLPETALDELTQSSTDEAGEG
jgi:NADH-quinone oxidoreductase subunit J